MQAVVAMIRGWWKRRRVGPRRPMWSPPDPIPDNDVVVLPGHRRWSDLLGPAGEARESASAWLSEPTRPLPLIAPLMTPGQRLRAQGGGQRT